MNTLDDDMMGNHKTYGFVISKCEDETTDYHLKTELAELLINVEPSGKGSFYADDIGGGTAISGEFTIEGDDVESLLNELLKGTGR